MMTLLRCLFCLLTALAGFSSLSAVATPPNVILILVDDLGWTDLGYMGSELYETPHIDRLAAEGTAFRNAYSACTVCSPSRAAVLTGKYPARLHLTDWIAGHVRPKAKLKVPEWTQQLPLEEITIAEMLRSEGYATCHIGKWHLGREAYYPEHQGFDRNIGGYFRGQPPSYFAPYTIPTMEEGPDGEYLTDRESEEAMAFISENRDRPFFIYLPHYCVHTPIQSKKALQEKYAEKVKPGMKQTRADYAAMIESLDQSVGRIRRHLEQEGLDQRTMLIFTSDNGGQILGRPPVTDNAPLRAGKGSVYEGGVRVPLIVYWPGVTRPGGVSDVPVMGIDFFPTLHEAAEVKAPLPDGVDGVSLVPVLRGTGELDRSALYWHYPHYHPGGATPYGAIRKGAYRLVQYFEDNRLELYDLSRDLGEQRDLAETMPDRARELAADLTEWRRSVHAQMPTLNPDWEGP